MGAELFIAGFVAVLFGAGWLVHHFSEDEKIRRLLRAASRWPIAELPESTQGRVVGRARVVDAPLTAPISGRECAYYIIEVILDYGDSKKKL